MRKTSAKPKSKTPRKKGAPSKFTAALAARICAELACGKSLNSVCKMDGMPGKRTVFDWLRLRPDFKEMYDRAKVEGITALAEDLLDIADDSSNDYIETEEGLKFNHEHIQRARLRVDTRKWIMAKLLPKKWGDKIDMNHGIQPEDPLAALIKSIQGASFEPVQKGDGEDDDDA